MAFVMMSTDIYVTKEAIEAVRQLKEKYVRELIADPVMHPRSDFYYRFRKDLVDTYERCDMPPLASGITGTAHTLRVLVTMGPLARRFAKKQAHWTLMTSVVRCSRDCMNTRSSTTWQVLEWTRRVDVFTIAGIMHELHSSVHKEVFAMSLDEDRELPSITAAFNALIEVEVRLYQTALRASAVNPHTEFGKRCFQHDMGIVDNCLKRKRSTESVRA
jgi:hypothetical protein